MNPRDSIPQTLVIACWRHGATSSARTSANAWPSSKTRQTSAWPPRHTKRRRNASAPDDGSGSITPDCQADRAYPSVRQCRETRTGSLRLDVPDMVQNDARAEGCAAWLDELPALVQSLAHDWSLTIGPTLRGGHAAFVAEATTS